MIFTFYLVVKRPMITDNSVVKIQSIVVNHESRPVKSNPVNPRATLHTESSIGSDLSYFSFLL